MRFQHRCEVEGCGAKATHLVIDWSTSWLFCLCAEHKDARLAEFPNLYTATPIVELPPPA